MTASVHNLCLGIFAGRQVRLAHLDIVIAALIEGVNAGAASSHDAAGEVRAEAYLGLTFALHDIVTALHEVYLNHFADPASMRPAQRSQFLADLRRFDGRLNELRLQHQWDDVAGVLANLGALAARIADDYQASHAAHAGGPRRVAGKGAAATLSWDRCIDNLAARALERASAGPGVLQ